MRAAGVAVTMAAAMLTATATPAHAGGTWTLADGFENNPAASWSFDGVGNRTGGFSLLPTSPRTGQGLAWIDVKGPGWAAVGRRVTVPAMPASAWFAVCKVEIYLIISNPGVGPVGLDIIDPRTWTYIASKQVTNTHFAYQLHSVTWNALGSPGTIFLRVVLPQERNGDFTDLAMDDVKITCQWLP